MGATGAGVPSPSQAKRAKASRTTTRPAAIRMRPVQRRAPRRSPGGSGLQWVISQGIRPATTPGARTRKARLPSAALIRPAIPSSDRRRAPSLNGGGYAPRASGRHDRDRVDLGQPVGMAETRDERGGDQRAAEWTGCPRTVGMLRILSSIGWPSTTRTFHLTMCSRPAPTAAERRLDVRQDLRGLRPQVTLAHDGPVGGDRILTADVDRPDGARTPRRHGRTPGFGQGRRVKGARLDPWSSATLRSSCRNLVWRQHGLSRQIGCSGT